MIGTNGRRSDNARSGKSRRSFFSMSATTTSFRGSVDVMSGSTGSLRGTKVSGGRSAAMLPNGGRVSALPPSEHVVAVLELRTSV